MRKGFRVVISGLLAVILAAALAACTQTPAQTEKKPEPLKSLSAEKFVDTVADRFSEKNSFSMRFSYKGRLAPNDEYAGRNMDISFAKTDAVWDSYANWVGFAGDRETERGKEYTLGHVDVRASYNPDYSSYESYFSSPTEPIDVAGMVEAIRQFGKFATGDVKPDADDQGYTVAIPIDLKTPFDDFAALLEQAAALQFSDAMLAVWYGDDKIGKTKADLTADLNAAFADDVTLNRLAETADALLGAVSPDLSLGVLFDCACDASGIDAQTLYMLFVTEYITGALPVQPSDTPYSYLMRCFGEQAATVVIDEVVKLVSGVDGTGTGLGALTAFRNGLIAYIDGDYTLADVYDVLAARVAALLKTETGPDIPVLDSAFFLSRDVRAARGTVTIKTDRNLDLMALGVKAFLDVKTKETAETLTYLDGEAAMVFNYDAVTIALPTDKPVLPCFIAEKEIAVDNPATFAVPVFMGSSDPAALSVRYGLVGVCTTGSEGEIVRFEPEDGLPALPDGLFFIADGVVSAADDFAAKTAQYAADLQAESPVMLAFSVLLYDGITQAESVYVTYRV